MFDLKVISEKEIKNKESNNLYEYIDGRVELYKLNSNNLSLTNTIETFRFLPINRTKSLFLINLPEDVSLDYFINYIGGEIEKIHNITIITDPKSNFRSLIIQFFEQDMADNFYYNYKVRSIKENKSEFLYFVFLRNITYIMEGEQSKINSLEINTNKEMEKEEKEEEYTLSQIPTCPLCLEKIETSNSGIETVLDNFPCERWTNYKNSCKVCNKLSPSVIKLLTCEKCNNKSSLWCCLICGNIGCSRYQNGHAVTHFKETNHNYSLELESQRIWDYSLDKWVHRLILGQNSAPINLDENMNEEKQLTEQEFYIRMESIINEYNKVLSSQLEMQRKYYGKEMDNLEEKYSSKNKEIKNRYNDLKEKIEEKKKKINSNNKFIKDCNKKINQLDKKCNEIQDKIEFNNICIKDLKKDNTEDKKEDKLNEFQKKKMAILEQKMNKKMELEKLLEEKYNNL